MLYRLRLAGIFRNRALLFRTIVFWLESTRGYLHLPVYYAGLLLRVQHDNRALRRGLRGAKTCGTYVTNVSTGAVDPSSSFDETWQTSYYTRRTTAKTAEIKSPEPATLFVVTIGSLVF